MVGEALPECGRCDGDGGVGWICAGDETEVVFFEVKGAVVGVGIGLGEEAGDDGVGVVGGVGGIEGVMGRRGGVGRFFHHHDDGDCDG